MLQAHNLPYITQGGSVFLIDPEHKVYLSVKGGITAPEAAVRGTKHSSSVTLRAQSVAPPWASAKYRLSRCLSHEGAR